MLLAQGYKTHICWIRTQSRYVFLQGAHLQANVTMLHLSKHLTDRTKNESHYKPLHSETNQSRDAGGQRPVLSVEVS